MSTQHIAVAAQEASDPTTAPTRSTPRRARLVVALLICLVIVNFADKVVVGLAGVDIKQELGIDDAAFGILQSSFFWLFAVGSVVGGWLSGRYRARWLLVVIALVWALVTAPMVLGVGFGVMVICRVLLGLAEGPTMALAMQVVHSWFPAHQRAVPSSLLIAGAGVGPFIAAPVLTRVITQHSWHAAFGVIAVAGLVVALLWLVFGREGDEDATGVEQESAVEPLREVRDDVTMSTLLRTGTVVGMTALLFVAYADTAVKLAWLPLYLREGLGYDASTAGRLTALPYLAAAIAVIVVGFVSRRMTRRGASARASRGLLAGGLVLTAGVATVVFASMDRGPLQTVLIVLTSCLTSGGYGIAFAGISDVVPARRRGFVFGIVTAVYSIGAVIAPIVMGRLVGAWSTPAAGYAHGFQILGVVMLAGAALTLLLVDPARDAEKLSRP